MGKTFKDQRAKWERAQGKEFVGTVNRHWRDHSLETQQAYDENRHANNRKIQHEGPSSGSRFGNQRKMRATMDVHERRVERRGLPDPHLDVDGELGLADHPVSPPKRFWSR